MQINFRGLTVSNGFYDTHLSLLRNNQTTNSYQKAYNELDEVSGKRNLEIKKLSDYGAAIAEIDSNGAISRYVSKDFHSAISAMQSATLKLQNEDKPSVDRKKPFEGHSLNIEG